MKTQIVNIEPHDDYGSVRDKVLWTRSPRVLLVWPGRGSVLSTKLDLVLLKRLGRQYGVVLGLVTFDPQVRSHARQLAFPLFDSVENLPESVWNTWEDQPLLPQAPSQRELIARPAIHDTLFKSPRRPLYRFLILLLPISFFISALLLLLPTAVITLQPTTLREFESVAFVLNEESADRDLILPLIQRTLEVDGEYRLATSGSQTIPDQPASGSVIFTNLTDDTVTVPAGTVIRSSSQDTLYFLTDETIQLKAGRGEQSIANITASTAGPIGNLAPETIDTVDGILGLSLRVTNPDETLGGSSRSRRAVIPADIRAIRRILEVELETEFLNAIRETLLPGEILLETTYEIAEVLDAVYDPGLGEIADSLSLNLTQVATISVIDGQQLESMIAKELIGTLPPGYIFAPGSPSILAVHENPDPDEGFPIIEIDFSLITYPEIDVQKIKESLRGIKLGALDGSLLQLYAQDLNPSVLISPAWWSRLPFFTYQIEVLVSPEASS